MYDAIAKGIVIEEYEADKPFPSCLILNDEVLRPIHVVCSYNDVDDIAVIITVYEPDNEHFEKYLWTRRKNNG